MAFLQIDHASKYFPESFGRRTGVHLQGRDDQDRERRVRHDHRAFGMREEHVAEHHRRVGDDCQKAESS